MATSQIYGFPIFVKVLLLAAIPSLISLTECHGIAQDVQELQPLWLPLGGWGRSKLPFPGARSRVSPRLCHFHAQRKYEITL